MLRTTVNKIGKIVTIGKVLNCREGTSVQQCRNSVCKIIEDGFDCDFKTEKCSCFSENVPLQCWGEVKLTKYAIESPIYMKAPVLLPRKI